MPLLFCLVLRNLLVRIGAAAVRNRREPQPEPLCATCSFAHMQYAARGKRTISCTFAGGVRLITIDVMYCTDYRDRSAPKRMAMLGFAPASSKTEMAEVATAGP